MVQVIKPKRSTTGGSEPTTSNLVEGEIAVNLADTKLFIRDDQNNINVLAEPPLPVIESASLVSLTGTLEVTSGSANKTLFASGNDGGEINVFAFDNTGQDIFTGMHFRTGANKKIFRMEAKSPGGTDPGDNSYESNFVISGSNNSMLSKAHNEVFKPFTFQAEEITFSTANTDSAIKIFDERAAFAVPIAQVQLAADPANPDNGWTYYNTTTDKLRLYAAGAWVDLN